MLTNSFQLFTVRGIQVRIHASWLLIFALLTVSLATGYFPEALPELDTAASWALGAVAALSLFGSVLLHELAHSFVAQARGLEAKSITLFIFGGVSNLGGEAKRPSVEFVVAIVGPLTSFAIAALAFGAASVVTASPAQALLGYLAIVNALVGAFNLIPGFPLDGGRVLRSIAWQVTGSLRTGTDIAAGAGQVIGGLLILFGIIQIVNGAFLNGLWIAAIGWFLQSAAQAGQRQVVLEHRLQSVRVGTIVRRDSTSVEPTMQISELIERHLLPGNRRAMPVVRDGRLIGIVSLSDIQEVRPDQRTKTTVADVMGGRDGVVTIAPTETLADAIAALGERDLEQVPVMSDGNLIGVLTRADVMRQLQLREELDIEPATEPARA